MKLNDRQHPNNAHAEVNEERKKQRIPAHVAWPLAIILLLVAGVTSSMMIVFAARSDGGAQVVENYYEKAVQWDAHNQLLKSSEAAGWTVLLDFKPATSQQTDRALTLQFNDRQGNPITNLTGTIKAYRPQNTQAIATMALQHLPETPGLYEMAFPRATRGLWDFEINVVQDTFKFRKVIRKELLF